MSIEKLLIPSKPLDVPNKVNEVIDAVNSSSTVVDQTYDPTSTSAQAGVAIAGAGFLTEHQDISGKANISDLATVATSGAYSDLTGAPSLATVATSGLYSDLTGTPGLATVATSGNYNDLTSTPTIPVVPTSLSSFTDDLGSSPTHTHSQYLTSHQDISGKEDILKTVNVLATSGTVELTDNSINSITPTAAVTFTLPTVSDNTKFHQILVQVNLSTVYTLTLGTSYFFNKTAPDMSTAGVYNLIYEYDKANSYWVVGAIGKGASA